LTGKTVSHLAQGWTSMLGAVPFLVA